MPRSTKTDQVILITGASSGLGAAAARACAQAGHRVALAARRVERLEALARELQVPNRSLIVPADVTDRESIRRMVAATEAHFGRVDVLLANAGVGHWRMLADMSDADVDLHLRVNVEGVVQSVRAVLPGMLQRGSGHILTVSSVAARVPSSEGVIYGATKGAVAAFTEGLRRELRGTGIAVTDLIPGFIRTEMTEDVPLPMPSPDIFGHRIVQLIRRPKARAVIPRYYAPALWLAQLAPGVMDWLQPVMKRELDRRRKQIPR